LYNRFILFADILLYQAWCCILSCRTYLISTVTHFYHRNVEKPATKFSIDNFFLYIPDKTTRTSGRVKQKCKSWMSAIVSDMKVAIHLWSCIFGIDKSMRASISPNFLINQRECSTNKFEETSPRWFLVRIDCNFFFLTIHVQPTLTHIHTKPPQTATTVDLDTPVHKKIGKI
jgi:hypothetical protein